MSRFADNFWGDGDHGVDVLLQRMKDGKYACTTLLEMFVAKIEMEEEYAKRLAKLMKTLDLIQGEEPGTFRMGLMATTQMLMTQLNAKQAMVDEMREFLEKPMKTFIEQQREFRKEYQTLIEKSLKMKQYQMSVVQKAEERFIQRKSELDQAAAQRSFVKAGKDQEKLEAKLQKFAQNTFQAEEEYTAEFEKLSEIYNTWINDMRSACDAFQQLDESRLDFSQKLLINFIGICSKGCANEDENLQKLRKIVERCEIPKDIQTFIRVKATGTEIPQLPSFRNYRRGPQQGETSPRPPQNQSQHRQQQSQQSQQAQQQKQPQQLSTAPQSPVTPNSSISPQSPQTPKPQDSLDQVQERPNFNQSEDQVASGEAGAAERNTDKQIGKIGVKVLLGRSDLQDAMIMSLRRKKTAAKAERIDSNTFALPEHSRDIDSDDSASFHSAAFSANEIRGGGNASPQRTKPSSEIAVSPLSASPLRESQTNPSPSIMSSDSTNGAITPVPPSPQVSGFNVRAQTSVDAGNNQQANQAGFTSRQSAQMSPSPTSVVKQATPGADARGPKQTSNVPPSTQQTAPQQQQLNSNSPQRPSIATGNQPPAQQQQPAKPAQQSVRKTVIMPPKPIITAIAPPGEQSDLRSKKMFFEKAGGSAGAGNINTSPMPRSASAKGNTSPQDIPASIDDAPRDVNVKLITNGTLEATRTTDTFQAPVSSTQSGIKSPVETNFDANVYAFGSAPDQQGKQELYKVRALYDYTANGQDELTIREGYILNVCSPVDQGWVECQFRDGNNLRSGIVPANYVEKI